MEIIKQLNRDFYYNKFTKEDLVKFIKNLSWISKEYNNNTSAGHPVKDDDIVRYSEETQRVKDKEP